MASQLAKYGDLVVGTSMTQALAYVYILGTTKDGPRAAILNAGLLVIIAIFLTGLLCAFAVHWCARREEQLRRRIADPHDVIDAARGIALMRIAALVLIHLGIAAATLIQPDFHWLCSARQPSTTTSPAATKIAGEFTATRELKAAD